MLPGSWETLHEHVVTWDKDGPKWLGQAASARRANLWDSDGQNMPPSEDVTLLAIAGSWTCASSAVLGIKNTLVDESTVAGATLHDDEHSQDARLLPGGWETLCGCTWTKDRDKPNWLG